MSSAARDRDIKRRQIITDGIVMCRGNYLNHAIAVESTLNELLTELYLPPNSLGVFKINFQDNILGTRGLSFSSKIDVMLSGMRDRGVPNKELNKFANELRRLNDFRNALAHADFDRISVIDRSAAASKLTPKNVTFHLNVYSANGFTKPTPVSVGMVNKRIKDEQPLRAKISEYWLQILESDL